MAHFFLYTGPGLLVLTIAASALVALVVWAAVTAAVALIVWTCWRLYGALHRRAARPKVPYSPGGKA